MFITSSPVASGKSNLMSLQSDLTLNASQFNSNAGSNKIKQFNEFLMDRMASGPKWFQVIRPATTMTVASNSYVRLEPLNTEI